MARECCTCHKRTKFGNSIARRGLAKYRGGVGLKTTGIAHRRFKPNLQKIRRVLANGAVERCRVCAKCLRSGKIKKPLRRVIPEGLLARMRAKEEAKSPEARRERKKEAGDRRRKRKLDEAERKAAKAKA